MIYSQCVFLLAHTQSQHFDCCQFYTIYMHMKMKPHDTVPDIPHLQGIHTAYCMVWKAQSIAFCVEISKVKN